MRNPPQKPQPNTIPRFQLDSSQCEILLAFEKATSLTDLGAIIGRDISVISRQLQRIAETAPVLEKVKGRWQLTNLGRQINNWTRTATSSQTRLIQQHTKLRFSPQQLPSLVEKAALLLIGVQRGFDDPAWGPRNNLNAEEQIKTLLKLWRERGELVIHIQHLSKERTSPLRSGSLGCDFKAFAKPLENELVVKKTVNSGFVGTNLMPFLKQHDIETIVLVGLSLNHCVDATARSGADMGFNVYIVSDATAAFDRIDTKGNIIAADDIQAATLANLNQEFATVIETNDLTLRKCDLI